MKKHVENRIANGHGTFKIDISGGCALIWERMFGVLDGKIKHGIKCILNFSKNGEKFDSSFDENGDQYHWPVWCLNKLLSRSGPLIIEYKGNEWKPSECNIRTVGNTGKLRFEGKLLMKGPGQNARWIKP